MSTAGVNTTNRTAVHDMAYLQHLIELHHMELFRMSSTSMLDLHEDGHRLQTSERHCNCDEEVIQPELLNKARSRYESATSQ